MMKCPTCKEKLVEDHGMRYHPSSGMELCHVTQEAEQERIRQHLADHHAAEAAARLAEPDEEP